MSEHEQLGRSWLANASAWCDAVRHQRIESRRVVTDRAIVDAVLERCPRTLLDLGCGEGWLARALAPHGIAVTGVDASDPLIRAAEELGGGTFLHAPYEKLPEILAPYHGYFDAVVANFSLLDDRLGHTLAALAPALAPRGRVIVQTVHPAFAAGDGPYADGWRVERFDHFPGHWPESMPWFFRTIASWSRGLAAAGYAIEEIREPLHPERGFPASVMFLCRWRAE